MKVDFFRHNITEEDMRELEKVVKGLFIAIGEEVGIFEEKLAEYLGIPYVVGLNSATAGLHLALLALGVGPGDEVITTPMSFIATSNTIIHAGATPVFVDVEPDTGNIDAARIEAAITDKTKAIMPVHVYGHLCDMREISRIAKKRGLKIIEDAAHALEARRDGVSVGGLGDAAAFSFYATKNITSGEGGAISVHTQELQKYLRQARLHGMSKDAAERFKEAGFQHYDMNFCGWKYNMSNIQAALLMNQIKRIESNLEKRTERWAMYMEELAGVEGIELPTIRPGARSAMHLFTVRVPAKHRDEVLTRLTSSGVSVAVNFRPIHLMSYYRERFGYKEGDFPIAEDIGARVVTIPFYPTLEPEKIKYVSDTLKEILRSF